MASTPFSTSAVGFAGQALPKDLAYRPGPRRFWLGQPSRMIQLPPPTVGYDAPGSKSETQHGLLGGGTAATSYRRQRRTWTLSWRSLRGRDWQIVNGFYLRLFGRGPWCFLNPEDRNRFPLEASMCGAYNRVAEGWSPTAGTVAFDDTVAGRVDPCGVVRWTGGTVDDELAQGVIRAGAPDADETTAAPVVPGEPATVSVHASTDGTATVRVMLYALDSVGTVLATAAGDPVALSGVWAPAIATLPAGQDGWWLVASIRRVSGAGDVLVTTPTLEYTDPAGLDPSTWDVGSVVPRVVLPAPIGRAVDGLSGSSPQLTLTEF